MHVDLRLTDVALLHWRVSLGRAQRLLPYGLRVEVVDGQAYAGLIAMRAREVRPLGLPLVPVLSSYLQVNVRLGVTLPDGTPAVHFRVLHVDSPVIAAVGRAGTGLPWSWARIAVARRADEVAYEVRPRGRDRPPSRLVLRPGLGTAGSALERRLVERDLLALRRLGHLRTWADEHPPWPLRSATAVEVDDRLVRAAGLEPLDPEPVSVLWSPGLPMQLRPGGPSNASPRSGVG